MFLFKVVYGYSFFIIGKPQFALLTTATRALCEVTKNLHLITPANIDRTIDDDLNIGTIGPQVTFVYEQFSRVILHVTAVLRTASVLTYTMQLPTLHLAPPLFSQCLARSGPQQTSALPCTHWGPLRIWRFGMMRSELLGNVHLILTLLLKGQPGNKKTCYIHSLDGLISRDGSDDILND